MLRHDNCPTVVSQSMWQAAHSAVRLLTVLAIIAPFKGFASTHSHVSKHNSMRHYRTIMSTEAPSTGQQLAFQGHTTSCLYGTLPGMLDMNKPMGSRWQSLNPNCQLKNYIKEYANNSAAAALQPLSILGISDSMDKKIMKAFCDVAHGSYYHRDKAGAYDQHNDHHTYNFCNATSTLYIAQVLVPTFTKTVERVETHLGVLDGYKLKMQLARTSWTEQHPHMEPDLVVMGGGMWDMIRWNQVKSSDMAPVEKKVLQYSTMNVELLDWWMGEVHVAILHAQSLFPKSKFIWRAYAMPGWDRATGTTWGRGFASKNLVAWVNAAGKTIAQQMGLEIVDVAQMVEGFGDPKSYLEDLHHPKPEIMLEVLNVMLNIARQNSSDTKLQPCGSAQYTPQAHSKSQT